MIEVNDINKDGFITVPEGFEYIETSMNGDNYGLINEITYHLARKQKESEPNPITFLEALRIVLDGGSAQPGSNPNLIFKRENILCLEMMLSYSDFKWYVVEHPPKPEMPQELKNVMDFISGKLNVASLTMLGHGYDKACNEIKDKLQPLLERYSK